MKTFRSYNRANAEANGNGRAQWFNVDDVNFDAATRKAIDTALKAMREAERAVEKAVNSGCVFSYKRKSMAFSKADIAPTAAGVKKLNPSDL